jgi:predicted nucleic-acid-binding Zn-ribbon protein
MAERPSCPKCGSINIAFDAAVRWDEADGGFDITHVFEQSGSCDDCEATDFYATWAEPEKVME